MSVEDATAKLIGKYPKISCPAWIADGYSPSLLDERVEFEIDGLNMSSSPGWPLRQLATSNRDIVDKHRSLLKRMVIERIEKWLSWDETGDPSDWLKAGLIDPYTIMIKTEPHKLKKLREHRERLIWCESTVTGLVYRCLFSNRHHKFISMWQDIPSKPGMGFSDESGQILREELSNLKSGCSSDLKGFDWTWTEEDFDNVAEIEIRLTRDPSELFKLLVRRAYMFLSWKILVLSDGTLYMQVRRGVMPSGTFVTGDGNSLLRVHSAYRVGAEEAVAHGDDAVESEVENAKEEYLKMGKVLKFYAPFSDHPEFCSHWFAGKHPEPLNLGKAVYNFLGTPSPEKLLQLAFELRHSPSREKVWDIISRSVGGQE